MKINTSANRPGRTLALILSLLLAGCATLASPDAQSAPVAPPATGPGAPLEHVQVLATGQAVTFKTAFTKGDLFLLKATGSVAVPNGTLDAEYQTAGATVPPVDVMAGTDVGIDTGLTNPRPPKGVAAGRMKWFGDYRADHTYFMVVTGNGLPLTLKLLRNGNPAASGSITVSLFHLPATEPRFGKPLETLLVPVLEKTVPTKLTTDKGAVYLLECAGDGKVGGGGLGRGDAEYMDYTADGRDTVDIGDANTDYGLGVDEADQKISPRLRWWGPWRSDHTYYLLFAGTGQPIHFFFYDVKGGYGDNSATDKLTVKVIAVP